MPPCRLCSHAAQEGQCPRAQMAELVDATRYLGLRAGAPPARPRTRPTGRTHSGRLLSSCMADEWRAAHRHAAHAPEHIHDCGLEMSGSAEDRTSLIQTGCGCTAQQQAAHVEDSRARHAGVNHAVILHCGCTPRPCTACCFAFYEQLPVAHNPCRVHQARSRMRARRTAATAGQRRGAGAGGIRRAAAAAPTALTAAAGAWQPSRCLSCSWNGSGWTGYRRRTARGCTLRCTMGSRRRRAWAAWGLCSIRGVG